jgi:hypothetical protein
LVKNACCVWHWAVIRICIFCYSSSCRKCRRIQCSQVFYERKK